MPARLSSAGLELTSVIVKFKKDASAAHKAGVIQDLQSKGGEVIKDDNIDSSSESRRIGQCQVALAHLSLPIRRRQPARGALQRVPQRGHQRAPCGRPHWCVLWRGSGRDRAENEWPGRTDMQRRTALCTLNRHWTRRFAGVSLVRRSRSCATL